MQKHKDLEFIDAPMHKVMLVGDESYNEKHVATRMQTIIESIDKNYTTSIFRGDIGPEGKVMCGKHLLEYAE